MASPHQQHGLAERAQRLADRLAEGHLQVAVLGEFKRGKSTFLNALVGRGVLPTGVIPVTTVATLLLQGDPGVTIRLLDGSEHDLRTGEDWLTTSAKPVTPPTS